MPPAADNDAARPVSGDIDRIDSRMLMQGPTRRQERGAQRGDQLPVVDLMILPAEHGAANARRQVRLHAPRLPAGQPVDFQAETTLEFIGIAQFGDIVAMRRDDQCAFIPVADIDTGYGRQFRREGRPGSLAFQIEGEQHFLAGLRLHMRGQHAGGSPACLPAGLAPFEDINAATGRRQPPADAQPADTAADDGDARPDRTCRFVTHSEQLPTLALSRSGLLGMISAGNIRHPSSKSV